MGSERNIRSSGRRCRARRGGKISKPRGNGLVEIKKELTW
jgi:hypothetical protein